MRNNTFTEHGANPGIPPRIDIIGSLHTFSIDIIKRLINIIPLILDLMYYLKTESLSTVFFPLFYIPPSLSSCVLKTTFKEEKAVRKSK